MINRKRKGRRFKKKIDKSGRSSALSEVFAGLFTNIDVREKAFNIASRFK